MVGAGGANPMANLSFSSLINQYSNLQSTVLTQVKSLASNISTATPGKFLLLQFGMAQVTQVGESISNLIFQVNSMINNAVRNQKGG